jgi:hypothetical protein
VRGPWPQCVRLVTIWRRISVPIVARAPRIAVSGAKAPQLMQPRLHNLR